MLTHTTSCPTDNQNVNLNNRQVKYDRSLKKLLDNPATSLVYIMLIVIVYTTVNITKDN